MATNTTVDNYNIIISLAMVETVVVVCVCVCVCVNEQTKNVQQKFFEQNSGSLLLDVSQEVYSVLVAAAGGDIGIVLVTDEDEGH